MFAGDGKGIEGAGFTVAGVAGRELALRLRRLDSHLVR